MAYSLSVGIDCQRLDYILLLSQEVLSIQHHIYSQSNVGRKTIDMTLKLRHSEH
jgi:hypothetical protein